MELIFTKGPKAGERFAMTAERLSIGRLSECDLELNQPNISRKHAFIKRVGNRVFILDNRSGNGTYVNGKRTTRAELRAGDEVRIGANTMCVEFKADEAKPSERPTRPDLISRFLVQDRTSAHRQLEFAGENLTLGRGEKCQLILDDDEISRLHATIIDRRGQFLLKDAGSANGTYLNGERIREAELKSGDRLELGGLIIKAQVAAGALHLVITRRPATRPVAAAPAREIKPAPASSPGAAAQAKKPRPRYTVISGLAIALAVALLLIIVGRTHAGPLTPPPTAITRLH